MRQQPDRGNSRTEATDGKGAGRNAAVKGKERVESMTFEDRLRERGLRYARFLGEKGQEDIYSFFDTLAADRGTLTETEMDALLKSYIDLGLIERNDGSQESREEAIRRLGDIKNTPLGEWVRDGYDEAPEVNRQGRLDGDYREVTGTEDREAKYKDNREGKSTGYREAENTDYREVKNTDYREVKDGTESSRDRNSSGSRQNPRRAADGTESIFENRFKYVDELTRMGANIKVEGTTAIITGVPQYTGTSLFSPDLRAGAALVMAALSAEGISTVDNIHYIARGYEDFHLKLQSLGAQIELIGSERELQKFKLKVG